MLYLLFILPKLKNQNTINYKTKSQYNIHGCKISKSHTDESTKIIIGTFKLKAIS